MARINLNPFKKVDGGSLVGNAVRGLTGVVKEMNIPIVSQVAAGVNLLQGSPPVLPKPETVSNGASPVVTPSKSVSVSPAEAVFTPSIIGSVSPSNVSFDLKTGGVEFVKSGLGGLWSYFSGTHQGAKVEKAAKEMWWESNKAKVYGLALAIVGGAFAVYYYFTQKGKNKYKNRR